jgi:hypothetical protein
LICCKYAFVVVVVWWWFGLVVVWFGAKIGK